MKRYFLFITLAFLGCKKDNKAVAEEIKPIIIQIQPFKDMSVNDAQKIENDIRKVYSHVELLAPIDFPKKAYYKPRNRYRADTIISYLRQNTKEGFVKIGLTNKDISVTKGENPDFGVMGLGYRPGKACVASTFRLDKNNRNSQFYKVAIHELGHTQGLKHCPNKTCFMRDAEGGNPTNELTDFCKTCKTFLISKHWKFS